MKETRDHILAVSSSLFLQKSFKAVSLKDIVEATQLSKGAFYHYFQSKEQLFLEVVDSIFSSIIMMDFRRLAHDSLAGFLEDYLSWFGQAYRTLIDKGIIAPSFGINYYSLLFDAIRFFPDVRDRLLAANAEERTTWLTVIGAARKSGEIASPLADAQIADIFIHINSGIGMNNIMTERSADTITDLRFLWGGFYMSLSPDKHPRKSL